MDAEREEGEKREQQTEAHEEVLAALKQLGKARAITVANLVGKDRSNTYRYLDDLWKAGKCKRDLIDNRPYYFIEEQHEDISDTKTTEQQYNKYNNTTLQHYNNAAGCL